MPIITGFPPSNTISPSVRITEQDLSFVPANQSFHRAALVGFASKGPINIPTLISTRNQLTTVFGYPHPDVGDPYLIYAAQQYLTVANELYVVRVAETDAVNDESAAIASTLLPAAGGPVVIQSNTAGAYNFSEDSFFRWRLNGVLSPKTLVVVASSYTCDSLVAYLNDQLFPDIDGIQFANNSGKIAVETTWAYGPNASLELVSVQNAIYGGAVAPAKNGDNLVGYNVTGLGTGMTPASITSYNAYYTPSGSDTGYGTAGYWDFSAYPTLTLDIVVDGTDNLAIDNVVQQMEFPTLEGQQVTTDQIVTAINDQVGLTVPGGFRAVAVTSGMSETGYIMLETLTFGQDAALLVKNTSTLASVVGWGNFTVYGTSASGISGTPTTYEDGIVNGSDNTNDLPCLTVTADSAGIDGNATSVIITNDLVSNNNGVTQTFNTFQIQVVNNGAVVESWGGLTMDPTSSYYVETYLPLVSDYVRASAPTSTEENIPTGIAMLSPAVPEAGYVTANNVGTRGGNGFGCFVDITASLGAVNNITLSGTNPGYGYQVGDILSIVQAGSNHEATFQITAVQESFVNAPPRDGTYYLAGGLDGIPSDPSKQDALLVGTSAGYTGIYSVSDPEQVDIDLIAVPGHSSTTVVEALLEFCGGQGGRNDCMAIIDPPFGLTVNEIVAWQNGTHPLNMTRFDSDFAALYWPWVKIRDTYNDVDVWVPPSGSVMAVYALSDNLGAPWMAPAGATRGVVPSILDVFSRPTLTERDQMYGNYNCVNPIVQFQDLNNFTVWGQKTMLRELSAFDRVNVRRCLFYIEKNIKAKAKLMLFDPNDATFQRNFSKMAKGVCETVRLGRGIYDYQVVCDSSINTPSTIDRNEFYANIGIQPTRSVEFMYITFSIFATGSWTENA
jgi:hypothetical protein